MSAALPYNCFLDTYSTMRLFVTELFHCLSQLAYCVASILLQNLLL